jgi:hypothetical protein
VLYGFRIDFAIYCHVNWSLVRLFPRIVGDTVIVYTPKAGVKGVVQTFIFGCDDGPVRY